MRGMQFLAYHFDFMPVCSMKFTSLVGISCSGIVQAAVLDRPVICSTHFHAFCKYFMRYVACNFQWLTGSVKHLDILQEFSGVFLTGRSFLLKISLRWEDPWAVLCNFARVFPWLETNLQILVFKLQFCTLCWAYSAPLSVGKECKCAGLSAVCTEIRMQV